MSEIEALQDQMNDKDITTEKFQQLERKVTKMMKLVGGEEDEDEDIDDFEQKERSSGNRGAVASKGANHRGKGSRAGDMTARGIPKNADDSTMNPNQQQHHGMAATSHSLRRKKKPTADEEEEHKKQAQELIARMREADENDREANSKKRPAIKKLIILEEIAKELRRLPIQYFFLDYNGCSVLANWLEPLPDGTYPNNRIVSEILQLIDGLQIDAEFLASSKNLGRIVKVYANNQANQPKEVSLAKSIMDKWGRMVFGISTTYKELGQGAGGAEDPEEMDEYYDEEGGAGGRAAGLDKYKRFKKKLTKMQEE